MRQPAARLNRLSHADVGVPPHADPARNTRKKVSLHAGHAGVVNSELSSDLSLTDAEIALVISVLGAKIEEILSDDP